MKFLPPNLAVIKNPPALFPLSNQTDFCLSGTEQLGTGAVLPFWTAGMDSLFASCHMLRNESLVRDFARPVTLFVALMRDFVKREPPFQFWIVARRPQLPGFGIMISTSSFTGDPETG